MSLGPVWSLEKSVIKAIFPSSSTSSYISSSRRCVLQNLFRNSSSFILITCWYHPYSHSSALLYILIDTQLLYFIVLHQPVFPLHWFWLYSHTFLKRPKPLLVAVSAIFMNIYEQFVNNNILNITHELSCSPLTFLVQSMNMAFTSTDSDNMTTKHLTVIK
jgi:hypothetical protein